MDRAVSIVVVSDIHYAGLGEMARRDPEGTVVEHAWLRPAATAFRALWLGQLSRNNDLFDTFLASAPPADLVIANGDFSCDSAFVGLSDDAAYASAQRCLSDLRRRFGGSFEATIGDHELGRQSLFGGHGGPRLASWRRSVGELKLKPFWQISIGHYEIIGVTSTLLALDAFQVQLLPEEQVTWLRLRKEHVDSIRCAFGKLTEHRRVILFCHDPAALGWLYQEEAVRSRIGQIDQTVVGHLHSRFVIGGVRTFAHLRNSLWRDFKVRVCPALACRPWPLPGLFCHVSLISGADRSVQFGLQRFHSSNLATRFPQ